MSPSHGRRFDPRVYRDPAPRPWLIHALGPVVSGLVLPHLIRVHRLDLPATDLARLRAAVQPTTAAFLGPNHPEFMTDWMIDKELSRRVAPLMAHWAAYEIVNVNPVVQRFWLANNLIAAAPGGGGKAYSVRWARLGHGVLLHPEGGVSWHADHIGALVGGIADMAWECAAAVAEAGERRPVYMVPIAWKLHFEHDAGNALAREIGHIERALALPAGDRGRIETRFAALQIALLARGAERLGFTLDGVSAALAPRHYFAAQEAAERAIRDQLATRYGPHDDEPSRLLHRLRRAVRARAASDPEGARLDRARLAELTRLAGFPRAIYDVPSFTQEHIAENLKRTRALLLTRGAGEVLHNLVPRAVAPRIAGVRVAEPVAVHECFAATAPGGADAAKARLLELHRSRLAAALTELIAAAAPVVDPYRRPNPLHSGGTA